MSKQEQHISIPFRTLKNPAYQNLSSNSKIILQQMLMHYYPSNPSRLISMPFRELSTTFGFSHWIITKCFTELVQKEFIYLEKKGTSHIAARYRLNEDYFKLKR